MRKRKEGKKNIIFEDWRERRKRAFHICNQIPVREHDPFRRTRRTAGIDDRYQIFWRCFFTFSFDVDSAFVRKEFVESDDGDRTAMRLKSLIGLIHHEDHL